MDRRVRRACLIVFKFNQKVGGPCLVTYVILKLIVEDFSRNGPFGCATPFPTLLQHCRRRHLNFPGRPCETWVLDWFYRCERRLHDLASPAQPSPGEVLRVQIRFNSKTSTFKFRLENSRL